MTSVVETDVLVTRKVKGLLNRLSETNLPGIIADFEILFSNYPRKLMTETFTQQLVHVLCQQIGLLESFVLVYASLIGQLSHYVGSDVLAYFTLYITQKFDDAYQLTKSAPSGSGDTTDEFREKNLYNMIFFLSSLYSYGLVSVQLLHDLALEFTDKFDELSVELLLKLLKHSGTQMRQDDPGAFKDIIVKIQDVTAGQGNKGSSRFKFMLELLEDLKSNKRKLVKGDSDLQGIGRKTFVSAIRRRGMTLMEPLKVTLKDARNKETNAKWLITGFARPKLATELAEKAFSEQQPSQGNKRGKVQLPTDADDFDLVHLADTQRMNTDIRRAIFSILMRSNNYLDAYEKLLDLKMTKKQNREIPKVLLHCVGQEASSYNPYYGILANHFVQHEGKDYSLTLMFCLWDTVKELKSYKVSKIRNFGMFFGFLLGKKAIQLTALKTISFENVKTGGDKELDFFTSILVSEGLLGLSPEDLLQSLKVIHRSKSNLYSFQDSFEFFLRHLLGHRLKKLKLSEEKQIKLKEQIELALEALEINGELRQQNGDGERNTESAEEANYDSFEDY